MKVSLSDVYQVLILNLESDNNAFEALNDSLFYH